MMVANKMYRTVFLRPGRWSSILSIIISEEASSMSVVNFLLIKKKVKIKSKVVPSLLIALPDRIACSKRAHCNYTPSDPRPLRTQMFPLKGRPNLPF